MWLVKLSEPGWEKDLEDEAAVQKELVKYICVQCRENNLITEFSHYEAMLATDCGCEFSVED